MLTLFSFHSQSLKALGAYNREPYNRTYSLAPQQPEKEYLGDHRQPNFGYQCLNVPMFKYYSPTNSKNGHSNISHSHTSAPSNISIIAMAIAMANV